MRNMILFVTVATVIIAAMLIGVSRSKVNAMPVAPPIVTGIDTSSSALSTTSPVTTASPSLQSTAPAPPQAKSTSAATAKQLPTVPSIGSIEVLNGCGVEGAAKRVADFLRTKGFDVKDIGNAPLGNYQSTMVISRTMDMGLANSIEKLLKTGKIVPIRNGNVMYDVTVIVGPDFEERIK